MVIIRVLIVCFFSFYVSSGSNYYISPNKLTWDAAEAYCVEHCKSNLASIHSTSDQQLATELASTINGESLNTLLGNIWIGLYFDSDSKTWKHSDGTPFDYSPNPAISADLSSSSFLRIQLNVDDNYQWITANNSIKSRFMCNHCDGILNKYFVMNEPKTFSDANLFCQNTFNTSLASIHNRFDDDLTLRLCKYGSIRNCWIGMVETEKVRYWIDDTTVDFLSSSHLFGALDNQCTVMDAYFDYEWNDYSCVGFHNFLCNLPSTTCYNHHWVQIEGKSSWTQCKLEITNGHIANTYQEWRNSNGLFVIEMRVKINENNGGKFGILLYDDDDVFCDNYFWIGMTSNWYVFIDRVQNGVFERVAYAPMPLTNLEDDFPLTIECYNKSNFVVKMNNYPVVNYKNANNGNNLVQLSGLIGVKSINMNITLFSLFVSGRPIIHSKNDLYTVNANGCDDTVSFVPTLTPTISPIPFPTMPPTNNPTSNATHFPTTMPTAPPMTNANITVSFNPTASPEMKKEEIADELFAEIKLQLFLIVILLIVLILVVIIALLCYCNKRIQAMPHKYTKSPSSKVESESEEEREIDRDESVDYNPKKPSLQSSHASDFSISLPKQKNKAQVMFRQGWTDNGLLSKQNSAVTLQEEVKEHDIQTENEQEDSLNASELYLTPKATNELIAQQTKMTNHGSEGKEKNCTKIRLHSPQHIEMQISDEGQRLSMMDVDNEEINYQTSGSIAF